MCTTWHETLVVEYAEPLAAQITHEVILSWRCTTEQHELLDCEFTAEIEYKQIDIIDDHIIDLELVHNTVPDAQPDAATSTDEEMIELPSPDLDEYWSADALRRMVPQHVVDEEIEVIAKSYKDATE